MFEIKFNPTTTHSRKRRFFQIALASVIGGMTLVSLTSYAQPVSAAAKNIVLVHGALLDGTTWQPVYNILTKRGFNVSIVQEPQTSLEADVAATKRLLDVQDGPSVLVGHSYGGMLITAAGADPKVKALVYVAAFAPDVGESVGDLSAKFPMPAGKDISCTPDGYVFYAPDKLFTHVAADVDRNTVNFMAASQKFAAGAIFGTKVSTAAWHSKPSYGIVALDDKTISPDLQREMYQRANMKTVEIKASHSVYISQPQAVARLIEEAANAVK